MTILKHHNSH